MTVIKISITKPARVDGDWGLIRIRVLYIVHLAGIIQTSNHYTLYIKLTLGS